jgi:hypothetical protein
MAARFSNLLWRFDLFLGGSIWIALLVLAYSAGPIEEAVFWASLIAALPIGFAWICRCILFNNGTADSTVVPPGSRARTEPEIVQAHKGGRVSQQKARAAAAVKPQSGFKSLRKSKGRAQSRRKRLVRR